MPLYLQVKLLRVLQERTITRLGATRSIAVDIRIIAATNDNIQDLMRQNMFRPDLFYRLNVFPIQTPPLRNRMDDLNLLINHFTVKYSSLFGKRRSHFQHPS